MNNKPIIGYWDIETSLLLLAAFTRYELRVPFSMVTQDWFMFCAAIQYEGKKTKLISILNDPERFKKDFTDDYHVIKELRDFIDSVDILIAHNGDHFDWKKFKAKLIKYKIAPPRKPILIDTYKESKTAQFTSGKLGDLSVQLDLPHKSHSNQGDWLIATLPYGTYVIGSKVIEITVQTKQAALKRIGEYNLKDIPPLVNLYKRLRPYMNRHPNLNQWAKDGKPVCTNCGSSNLNPDGSTRGFPKFRCGNCGHHVSGMKRKYTMKVH
jgi:hypothetical protein